MLYDSHAHVDGSVVVTTTKTQQDGDHEIKEYVADEHTNVDEYDEEYADKNGSIKAAETMNLMSMLLKTHLIKPLNLKKMQLMKMLTLLKMLLMKVIIIRMKMVTL